jgi:hypothetical protein
LRLRGYHESEHNEEHDMAEVKGHQSVKRMLEIAAARHRAVTVLQSAHPLRITAHSKPTVNLPAAAG